MVLDTDSLIIVLFKSIKQYVLKSLLVKRLHLEQNPHWQSFVTIIVDLRYLEFNLLSNIFSRVVLLDFGL